MKIRRLVRWLSLSLTLAIASTAAAQPVGPAQHDRPAPDGPEVVGPRSRLDVPRGEPLLDPGQIETARAVEKLQRELADIRVRTGAVRAHLGEIDRLLERIRALLANRQLQGIMELVERLERVKETRLQPRR